MFGLLLDKRCLQEADHLGNACCFHHFPATSWTPTSLSRVIPAGSKSLPSAEKVFDLAKDNKRSLCVFSFSCFTKAIACAAPVTRLLWRALIRRRTDYFLRVLLQSQWLRSDKGKALANYQACLEMKRSIYMVLQCIANMNG